MLGLEDREVTDWGRISLAEHGSSGLKTQSECAISSLHKEGQSWVLSARVKSGVSFWVSQTTGARRMILVGGGRV